jgi:parallel beta-helix repeat protein
MLLNDTYGILLNGSLTNVTVKNCPRIYNFSYGVYSLRSNESRFINDSATGDFAGFLLNNSRLNSINNCSASYGLYGFAFINSSLNNLTNSSSYNLSDLGDGGGNPDLTTGGRAVYLSQGSNNNLIQGNLLYNSSIFGINADHSNGTVIRGNEIYGIVGTDIFVMPGVAIGLADTAATTIDSNSIHDSTGGAVFDTTEVNVLSGNNITNNLWVGVYMEETAYSNFSANRISGSMSGMIHGLSGATSMRNDHFFNNSLYDMNLSMPISFPGAYINLSGVSFDRPAGDFTNYTNLSLDDNLGIEEYTISWSAEPSAPPSSSFAGKYLDITNQTPDVSIDDVIWHWNDAELTGYNESRFGLWKHNASGWGSWALNNTPDISGNTLTLTNMNPASIYAILQNTSSGPNASLAIYDQFEGGNVTVLTDIAFFANYTNATSGNHLPGAACLISFDDNASGSMADTGSQYNFTKSGGFSAIGIHLWNVTCSKAGYEALSSVDSVLVVEMNATNDTWTLYGANITNSTDLPRWEGQSAGNMSTLGGNLTPSNLSASMLSDHWAAFYGNISGNILLGNLSKYVYTWLWGPADGGVICASTNSTVNTFSVFPGYAADIDSAWAFSSQFSDSGNRTFTGKNCTMSVDGVPVDDSDYADTGTPGGFKTCAYKSYVNPAKNGLLFCTDITGGGPLWNGQSGDFEILVPTAFGPGATETYYMYVNFN